MSNKRPIIPQKLLKNLSRYTDDNLTPQFKAAKERHRAMYQLLLRNNQHLLSISGKTLLGQLKEFQKCGVRMSRQCYYDILKGAFFSNNFALPFFFEDYWGIPVNVLMFEDLSKSAEWAEYVGRAVR